MKNIRITVLFIFSSLIMSCGFHLRGQQDISAFLPEVQLLGVNQHSQLGRELITALNVAKVNVLDESDTLLSITQNQKSKRVLSVDSAGRANQYELSYQLGFSIVKKAELKKQATNEKQVVVDLVPAQTIKEKREYLFDSNLVLAKADEENRLYKDMRQAAIRQLIRRLHFSLKKRQSEQK